MERPRWRIVQSYKEAYGGLPRAAWLLALLELVNRSGMMVLFFFTLYMTRRLGFSVVQAGTVMSAYGAGSMAGTYLGGRLCDRLGAYHVQKLSLGVSAALLVALQLPRSPWLLALLMLALAAFSDALHPANAAATAQICTPELRPKGFALHRLAGNLGVSIGPVVGGYLALLDYKWLFWADGLTSLLACGLAFVCLPSAGPHGEAHAAAARPAVPAWRNAPFLRLLPLVFGIGLVFAQFFSTYPLYLRLYYGLPESGVGRLIAVNTLLIVAVEMALMHALRRQAPTRVIAVGTLLLGLGFGLTPFGSTTPFAVLSVVVWTLGEILTLPMLLTLRRCARIPRRWASTRAWRAWRSPRPRPAGRCWRPGCGTLPDRSGCGTRARRSARRWRSASHGCRANATPTRPRPPSWPRDGGLDAKSDGALQRFASAAADASA